LVRFFRLRVKISAIVWLFRIYLSQRFGCLPGGKWSHWKIYLGQRSMPVKIPGAINEPALSSTQSDVIGRRMALDFI
jgi:hypothetical protein